MSKTLRGMIGDYPNTLALKTGKVSSDHIKFDFADVKVPNTAFKRVVAGEFDVAELAIMTYLQARAYNKGLVALPLVLQGRFQHSQISYNAERGVLTPKDLPGRRVGLRTYPQTTPTWVRGILQQDYGVDLDRINWVTFEAGHVPEYSDPPNAQRAPAGKQLIPMLLAGEIDAAVTPADPKYPQMKPLIPDPAAGAKEWRQKYNAIQVNHIVVVKESLAKSDPQAVREIYRLVSESKQASTAPPSKDGIDFYPVGYAANRRNFEVAAQYAWQQRLIPRELAVDELFDDVTRVLGK